MLVDRHLHLLGECEVSALNDGCERSYQLISHQEGGPSAVWPDGDAMGGEEKPLLC